MRWENLGRSSNVEDMRGRSGGRGIGGRGLFIPVRFLLRSTVGRIILAVGVVAYLLGYNPLALLSGGAPQSVRTSPQEEQNVAFVSAVLGQTEKVWRTLFAAEGRRYVEPKLLLFRDGVRSACGYAGSQTGPFYCPGDRKIYLDLSFFDALRLRHNAPGDFAQAYVIAHEVGHHVQNLLGTLDKSHRLKQYAASQSKANAVQVMVELQADCFAGVWAHHVHSLLEPGDIEEALNAASAIGDDTLQKQAQGYVVPDAFTHGSAKERMRWFRRGYDKGTMGACRTGI